MEHPAAVPWPLKKEAGEDAPRIIISGTTEEDIEHFEADPNEIMVMTEGWVEGPVAAILRGGGNARATLEVLARSGLENLMIYHLEERIPELEDLFLASVPAVASALFENVNISWRHDQSIYRLIEEIGSGYKMLFFGAPLAKSEIVPLFNRIKQVFEGSVTIVRGPVNHVDPAEGDEINEWVRKRTFHSNDFSLPVMLRNHKKKRNLKTAMILPTLNEEKTIRQVIAAAKEVKNAGLIDELIVIDSDSTDNTVQIARSYDIPVFYHREIRPDLGSFRGKGEAMFKSAFVTEADILAWVDTDIDNITPRFFYGLLGPIVTFPSIQYVKGFFDRPVRVEAHGIELGGGRVTEILARPWINTFAPQVSGYIQPLAGTVAISRRLLERIKIPTTYGVELAMLLQVVENGGLWSTCQVNLGEVIHKSKDVLGLSEMAFQIIQVAAELKHQHEKVNSSILRRVYSSQGRFEIGIKRFQTGWRSYQLPVGSK